MNIEHKSRFFIVEDEYLGKGYRLKESTYWTYKLYDGEFTAFIPCRDGTHHIAMTVEGHIAEKPDPTKTCFISTGEIWGNEELFEEYKRYEAKQK